MAAPPPHPDANDEADTVSGHGSPTSTPRWVTVVGIIVIILFVLFIVVQHLIGGGMAGLHQ